MGKGKSIVIGFRYYIGLHMGLNQGECDEITEVVVGGRTAWSGSVTDNGSVPILAPELFGGDKAEGGIVGRLDVMMGGPAQPVNVLLADMLGGLVPAFRGKTTLFYDGQFSAMNPYPKPWSFRRSRNLKGWDGEVWYPEKAIISLAGGTIKAANPAHIVYQCFTNRKWGRGLVRSRLNDAAFRSAADTFYAEGFGLCMEWKRQDSISNFVQSVLDHAGAMWYEDPSDGTIGLRLIRGDYDPEDLPLFTLGTGLLGIDDDDNASQASSTNELVVKYRRPQDNTEGKVRVQSLASIQALGKLSQTRSYPGIPTAELAVRVAQRDLAAASGFMKHFRLRFDRRAADLQPGKPFRISVPDRGIINMVLRAGPIQEGEWGDGKITISAVQDRFGLPATSYTQEQPSTWIPPDRTPQPIATRAIMEAPYWDLVRSIDQANLDLVASTAGYLIAMALRPTGLSMNYDIRTRIGPSGSFVSRSTGSFTPTGTLAGALSISGTAAVVTNGEGLPAVSVGSAALIDNEVVRVDSIDLISGAVTLGRSCLDTVPATHALGARVWFFGDLSGEDPTEYTSGSIVYVRLITQTGLTLDEGLAGTDSVTLAQRQYRPYPPGRLRVNGNAYPASITGDLVVSWAHRDRITQADQLVDGEQTSVGPEAGTTYTLRIYSGATLKRTVAALAGTTYTYLNATEVADGGPFNPVRFTLHAVRDGIESLQGHDWSVARI